MDRENEMSILENELVRKYFGCIENDLCGSGPYHDHSQYMSWNVLAAMEQPIKKNERYLSCNFGELTEVSTGGDLELQEFHPLCLRLPDRFQEKKYEHCDDKYKNFHTKCCLCGVNKPDPIEAKVEELVELRKTLQELIRMARESK